MHFFCSYWIQIMAMRIWFLKTIDFAHYLFDLIVYTPGLIGENEAIVCYELKCESKPRFCHCSDILFYLFMLQTSNTCHQNDTLTVEVTFVMVHFYFKMSKSKTIHISWSSTWHFFSNHNNNNKKQCRNWKTEFHFSPILHYS